MGIDRISIKALSTASMIFLGVAALVLSVVVAKLYRDAALESQTGTLSRIIEVAGKEVIKQLDALSVDLGAATQKSKKFRKAVKKIKQGQNQKTVTESLNDQFFQRFVTSGKLDLAKLRVYNVDFELIGESSEGTPNLPKQLPSIIYNPAKDRKKAHRLKSLGGMWAFQDTGYYSVLVPIGGLRLLAYLEVVTRPAFNLRKVENILQAPLTIYALNGEIHFQSDGWNAGQNSSTLPVSHVFVAKNGSKIIRVEILENIEGFIDKFQDLQISSILVFVGIIGGVLLLSIWTMGRFVFEPLKKFMSSMERCSHGDLTVQITPNGLRDIKVLGAALKSLVESLRSQVQEIDTHSESLANAAEELSVITQQTSFGVQEQQKQTDLVVTAITQMSATVQEVAINAQSAAAETKMADEKTTIGLQTVSSTMSKINSLADEMAKASDVIAELQSDSDNIGAIVDVIRGIAEQTNLLALNAAIEAARAGEQGRGFAVVADEVRTLASRTQQSTEEIRGMVERLQEGASKAVKVMHASQSCASDSVTQAEMAESSINDITSVVARINDMNTQIASAAEEQTVVSEDITRNVVSISQVFEQTATAANQTASAGDSLAILATQLQQVVGKFKL